MIDYGYMEDFINNFKPTEGDHIEPYAHHTCATCDGAIDPMASSHDTILWKHVFSTPYDHIPIPLEGTFDMFPPSVIAVGVQYIRAAYHRSK